MKTTKVLFRLYYLIVISIFGLVIIYFRIPDSSLEIALEQAGKNRKELEKVLVHYGAVQKDSLKLKAAKFLIGNMPGHYAFDSSSLALYRPILQIYDSLYRLKKSIPKFEYSDRLNKMWDDQKNKHDLYENIYKKPVVSDIENVNSRFLISQIDQAFSAWALAKQILDIDFSTFCEYVLPYRKQNGVCVEDWRTYFKNDNIKIESRLFHLPVETIVDSILYQYSEFSPRGLKHTGRDVVDYPYLKLSDVCISKRVLCETRCWFNSMLLASLGLPVSIDYVPAWGNRDSNHAWNVIITKKGSLAFEPFWDRDRWKYKKIYNNKDSDNWWGKFRLAKVFRLSFSSVTEGPAVDNNEKPEDVPPFFLNVKQKDVSEEYFITSDVHVELGNKPLSESKYLWLCVFDSHRWTPVQWGKIENGKIVFKKMGQGIVYLPAFYINGNIIPAATPFILTDRGQIKPLKAGDRKKDVNLTRKFPLNTSHQILANALVGSEIQVSNDKDFQNNRSAFQVRSTPKFYMESFKLNLSEKYRYARFLFSEPNLSGVPACVDGFPQEEPRRIAELAFFNNLEMEDSLLTGKVLFSQGLDSARSERCFDNDILTVTAPYFKNYEKPDECNCWIGLDFQKKQTISSFAFCPQNDRNNIFPGLSYELFYWDNEWVSLGVQKANNHVLVYSNVPQNALLFLHCLDEGKEERIFTYEDGEQIWW